MKRLITKLQFFQALRRRQCQRARGFTLLEVLIVALFGGIIISGLLWIVVSLAREEEKEAVLTATEQEMQLALNYILSDLREAVYIYDGGCNPLYIAAPEDSCPGYEEYLEEDLVDGLPEYSSDATPDSIPVLAFWKTDPANLDEDEYDEMCDGTSPDLFDPTSDSTQLLQFSDCQNIFKQRYTYTFVLYIQEIDDDSTDNWEGDTRIRRYALNKYANSDSEPIGDDASDNNDMARSQGYVNPAELGANVFANWPLVANLSTADSLPDDGYDDGYNCQDADADETECGALADGTTLTVTGLPVVVNGSNPAVLVDFVDAASGASSQGTDPVWTPTGDATGQWDVCPSGDYELVPRDLNGTPDNRTDDVPLSNSFYACVRAETTGDVQDVIVFLRGDVKNRNGLYANIDLPTETLRSQLSLRSVLDRTID